MNHFSAKIFISHNTSLITPCTYCQFLLRTPWMREWEIIYSVLPLLTPVSLSITILRYHHSSRSLSTLIQKPALSFTCFSGKAHWDSPHFSLPPHRGLFGQIKSLQGSKNEVLFLVNVGVIFQFVDNFRPSSYTNSWGLHRWNLAASRED